MEKVWEALAAFLGSEAGQAAIVALIAIVFGVVKKLQAVKKYNLDIGVAALEVGVQTAYEEYVRSLKDSAADGKLTDEEKEEARARAVQSAKTFAAEKGVDLVKLYGEKYIPVLIEKVIKQSKTAGNAAKNLFPESLLPQM